jgi:hypothetical protein
MTVYLIGSESGVVKIGYSADPDRRLSVLQSGSHLALNVLATFEGGRELESRLHDWFNAHRIRGEWFELGEDPVGSVRDAIVAIEAGALAPPPVGSDGLTDAERTARHHADIAEAQRCAAELAQRGRADMDVEDVYHLLRHGVTPAELPKYSVINRTARVVRVCDAFGNRGNRG